jgi:hypothetical protein
VDRRWIACASPTTSPQPIYDADSKTVVSPKTLGSRSSRADFSSSNLKIKTISNFDLLIKQQSSVQLLLEN